MARMLVHPSGLSSSVIRHGRVLAAATPRTPSSAVVASRPRNVSTVGAVSLRSSFLPHALVLKKVKIVPEEERRRGRVGVEASASSPSSDGVGAGDAGSGLETAQAGAGSSELGSTLRLGSLFGLWYLFNIYFNIYNKQACPILEPALHLPSPPLVDAILCWLSSCRMKTADTLHVEKTIETV